MPDDEKKASVTTEKQSPESEGQEQFLKTARNRLDRSATNESDERTEGQEDVEFIYSTDQWDSDVKDQRGKGRLCLTLNKHPMFLDQIDGDLRQHRPAIKVKAVDSDADPITADVIEGIIRYVERNSAASRIYSYGGLHAAASGRGAWRVLTQYVSDSGFEQEITIERIINAFSVYYDPAAKRDDKQDGDYMFIVSDISKDTYKEKYPDFTPVDFEASGTEFGNWTLQEGTVRIAEYFYKEKVEEKEIHLTEDDEIVDGKDLGNKKFKMSRKVPVYKVRWAKIDGKNILEGGPSDPIDVAGMMFPIVLTWGKQLCVDGTLRARGIARHSKDAQKLYNYFRSNDAEATALQPKQPYLIPDICLGPYKDTWDKAHDTLVPYLPYVADPTQPGLRPHRESPAQLSTANREQIAIADSEIRDTIGLQQAALGMPSNERTGVAIRQRKMESDTGQYAFMDNLAQAVRTTGKIILGMIPEVIDTERQIRILGNDMKEKVVLVNGTDGKFDLTVGRYDVDIDAEASYSTQREEFQEKLVAMLPYIPPEQVAVMTDILFEMQDFTRADDLAERIRKTIPPEILGGQQGQMPGQEGMEGVPPPPPEPPQPDPMAMMQLETEGVKLETLKIKQAQEQAKLEGIQLDNELKIKIEKDNIKAVIAEVLQEEQQSMGAEG